MIVVVAGAAYLLFTVVLPAAMSFDPALTPLCRLSRAVAPLVGTILLLPLLISIWRMLGERWLVRQLTDLASLRAMTWDQLEMVVRRLYEQQGFSAQRIGGAGADGGVDLQLQRGGRVWLVQCKQWRARQVGIQVVRELAGVVAVARADGGIVVTCGSFTGPARLFAARSGLVLVDGITLLRMKAGERCDTPSTSLAPAAPPGQYQSCPRCGARMVPRVAKSGRARERAFLGCSNYPLCKGTRRL